MKAKCSTCRGESRLYRQLSGQVWFCPHCGECNPEPASPVLTDASAEKPPFAGAVIAEFDALWADERNSAAVSVAVMALGSALLGGIITVLVRACDKSGAVAVAQVSQSGCIPVPSTLYAALPLFPLGVGAYFLLLLTATQHRAPYMMLLERQLQSWTATVREGIPLPGGFHVFRQVWERSLTGWLWVIIAMPLIATSAGVTFVCIVRFEQAVPHVDSYMRWVWTSLVIAGYTAIALLLLASLSEAVSIQKYVSHDAIEGLGPRLARQLVKRGSPQATVSREIPPEEPTPQSVQPKPVPVRKTHRKRPERRT
jgi:hypothetical protein